MGFAPSADSSLRLSLLTEARSKPSAGPSQLEEEVTRLFDELRVPLLRYLFSLGLPAPDGDEVVQEVFLALFRHLQQGKSQRNLRGWLFRVAHNLGLKRSLSNRRARQFIAPGGAAPEHCQDSGLDPEEQVASRQREARLLAVVRALPEQDRCCLHLRAEGLRYREIAKVLGISLGAVSLSMQRSLARLSRADGC